MKLSALEINQNIGKFYLGKIDYKLLISTSEIDVLELYHNLEEEDLIISGIQRKSKSEKIKKIKEYLSSKEATFPNNIILNVKKSNFEKFENGKIYLKDNEKVFQVIDGQHRLKGLEESKIEKFEVPISIFVGLEDEEQSRVFITINTEQTKIDPSVAFYQEINDKYNTPRKFVVNLIKMFYLDKNSPWYEMIKLLGYNSSPVSKEIISSKSFGEPILELIYNDNQYYNLRNDLVQNKVIDEKYGKNKILWSFYKENNLKVLYKIFLNYFSALKSVFSKDWANKESLLNKTTGHRAVIHLFKDLYETGLEKGDLSFDYFKSVLGPLEKLNGKISSQYFASSGTKASKDIYRELKKNLY